MSKRHAAKGGKVVKRHLSFVMKEILTEIPKRLGGNQYMGKEADAQYFGIPIPCLAFQWALKNTCLPIGKMIGLAGKPKSHKSSLGFEFARWVFEHDGYAHLVENESGKYDAKIMRSIMGDENFEQRFLISEAQDGYDAQKKLTATAMAVRANKKRDELWLILLDSMSGTEVKEDEERVRSEGFAGRAFPASALSWTRYLKDMTSWINTFPTIFLSINHLKDKPSQLPGGAVQKNSPGGVAQLFHSSVFLWISFKKQEHRDTWEIDGKTVVRPTDVRTVLIECNRSSIGPERRNFQVDFCFFDGLDGKPYAYVDWDGATGRWLYENQSLWGVGRNPEGGKADYKRLKELLSVDVHKGRYTCEYLELDGVEAHTLGRAVHANRGLMDKLTDFLGIKRNLVWKGALPVPEVEPPEPKTATEVEALPPSLEGGAEEVDDLPDQYGG